MALFPIYHVTPSMGSKVKRLTCIVCVVNGDSVRRPHRKTLGRREVDVSLQ